MLLKSKESGKVWNFSIRQWDAEQGQWKPDISDDVIAEYINGRTIDNLPCVLVATDDDVEETLAAIEGDIEDYNNGRYVEYLSKEDAAWDKELREQQKEQEIGLFVDEPYVEEE